MRKIIPLALLLVGCATTPPVVYHTCAPSYVPDKRALICASTETQNIPDDDPALAIFRDPGEALEDTKVDLAIERANVCDSYGPTDTTEHDCSFFNTCGVPYTPAEDAAGVEHYCPPPTDPGDDRTPDERGCPYDATDDGTAG